jgi:hypothetical protein
MLCALVAVVTCGTHGLSGQGTPVQYPVFEDNIKTPPTLAGLAAAADAIATVKVVGKEFKSVNNPRTGRVKDTTQYDLEIVDVVKPYAYGGLSPNGRISIERPGGQHEEKGRLVQSVLQGSPPMVEGSEYVMFFTWNNYSRRFDVAYGPDGTFGVDASNRIVPYGHSNVASAQRSKTVTDFVNEVRANVQR